MPVNLKGRSFLTLKDFTPDEIRYMLNLAADLKAKKRAGIRGNLLAGKNIVLLFEKTSTRTRCAFEVAAYDEGANVTFLDSKSSQMGKKETMVDTAKVLGRFYDGIEYRGYDQKVVEGLAANAGVPVWNGLTDVDHPTQALADILTLMENTKKPLSKCKLVFCGDTRNNVAYCLMYICAKLGIHYVGWGPKELAPAADVVEYCREVGKETGAVVEYGEDRELIKGADALYTDIWASMGEEDKIPERVKLLTPYKVTGEVLKVIRALAEEHMTMVIVTHEMAFARAVADKVIFMDKGKIDAMGTPKEIFEERPTARLREFLSTFTTPIVTGDAKAD